MGNECVTPPDWDALAREEQARGQSIDPETFFGCDPSGYPPMSVDPGPGVSVDPGVSIDPGTPQVCDPNVFDPSMSVPDYQPPQVCEDPGPMSVDPGPQVCEDPGPMSVDPGPQVCEDPGPMSVDPGPQVCEDPGPLVCEDPNAPVPAPAPPAVGLDSYQVVPDDFVGPLGPNQIRQSQRDTLDHYNFGGMSVVPDDFNGPLQPGQMRQADYARLQSGWLNITSGQGIHMTGTPENQEHFLQMMRANMDHSNVMQGLVSTIGNDTDPAHRIEADLDRGQDIHGTTTGVYGDTFATNQIDLADLDFSARAPDPAHPNSITQTERLVHILAERRDAVTSANPHDFGPHHTAALAVQNQVRDEWGQSHVVSQTGSPNAAGGVDGVYTFADGTQQTIMTDAHNNPTGTVLP